MSRFVPVAKVSELSPGQMKMVVADQERLLLVNMAGTFYAISDTCSHEDYSLCEGELYEDEREIECWKHGSTFSLDTGEPQSLPEMRTYRLHSAQWLSGNACTRSKKHRAARSVSAQSLQEFCDRS